MRHLASKMLFPLNPFLSFVRSSSMRAVTSCASSCSKGLRLILNVLLVLYISAPGSRKSSLVSSEIVQQALLMLQSSFPFPVCFVLFAPQALVALGDLKRVCTLSTIFCFKATPKYINFDKTQVLWCSSGQNVKNTCVPRSAAQSLPCCAALQPHAAKLHPLVQLSDDTE